MSPKELLISLNTNTGVASNMVEDLVSHAMINDLIHGSKINDVRHIKKCLCEALSNVTQIEVEMDKLTHF